MVSRWYVAAWSVSTGALGILLVLTMLTPSPLNLLVAVAVAGFYTGLYVALATLVAAVLTHALLPVVQRVWPRPRLIRALLGLLVGFGEMIGFGGINHAEAWVFAIIGGVAGLVAGLLADEETRMFGWRWWVTVLVGIVAALIPVGLIRLTH